MGAGWRGRREGGLGLRHAVGSCSLVPCPLRARRPSTLPVARGAPGTQSWTAPALISGLQSLLQLPGCPEICELCPRRCQQSSPTCTEVFPNLERAGEGRGRWGGRRYADSESEFPLESLKSVHVLKKDGTNLRSQPRGHVPPPSAPSSAPPQSPPSCGCPGPQPQPSHWWKRFWKHPRARETLAV